MKPDAETAKGKQWVPVVKGSPFLTVISFQFAFGSENATKCSFIAEVSSKLDRKTRGSLYPLQVGTCQFSATASVRWVPFPKRWTVSDMWGWALSNQTETPSQRLNFATLAPCEARQRRHLHTQLIHGSPLVRRLQRYFNFICFRKRTTHRGAILKTFYRYLLVYFRHHW